MEGDDKRRARLNCIRHILGTIPYTDAIPGPLELTPRPPRDEHYVRPPREAHVIVQDLYAHLCPVPEETRANGDGNGKKAGKRAKV